MLQDTLAARKRVLGSAHPDTLDTADNLEFVRSQLRAMKPTKKSKAAARKEDARLSPTALADAEARAAQAAAELLAMLELEEPEQKSKKGKGKR